MSVVHLAAGKAAPTAVLRVAHSVGARAGTWVVQTVVHLADSSADLLAGRWGRSSAARSVGPMVAMTVGWKVAYWAASRVASSVGWTATNLAAR